MRILERTIKCSCSTRNHPSKGSVPVGLSISRCWWNSVAFSFVRVHRTVKNQPKYAANTGKPLVYFAFSSKVCILLVPYFITFLTSLRYHHHSLRGGVTFMRTGRYINYVLLPFSGPFYKCNENFCISHTPWSLVHLELCYHPMNVYQVPTRKGYHLATNNTPVAVGSELL